VARELVDALEARGIGYVVVEYNPHVVRDLRVAGVPVIYGDASNPAALEHAHVERARLLAVLMPDRTATEQATRVGRRLNPRLDIVARAGGVADLERLRKAGATEVVQPEFEAGVEVIRHALRRFGIGGVELAALTTGRRATFYRRAAADY
jgi:CPA2 family monovalent cation:H+ antiporter-2